MQILAPTNSEGAAKTVIEAGGGWQAVNVAELWRFRELMFFLTWRDVKVRYKQTVLGAAWAVLQPAMMMAAIMLVLGKIAGVDSAKSPVFVYAGMLPWTFFATAMANAANSLVNSERLITKIYFPRLAVPFASVGAAVVDFAIASTLMVGMMIWYGITPGIGLLMVPVIFFLIVLAAAGVGTMLSALTVAYRDFRYIIPFLAQFWLFATPTIYTPLPETGASIHRSEHLLILFNPLSGLIAAFRSALLNQPIPWALVTSSAVMVIVIFVAACFYFRRVEDSFADVV
jgi:lipopolysaccharide transport system permease protein